MLRTLLLTLALSALLAAPAAAQQGTWTPTADMRVARNNTVSVLLNSGKVLVIGGNNDPATGAEVFDPATGTWTLTGPMLVNRWPAGVAKLTDGRVLAAGSSSSEVYSPATNQWTFAGPLPAVHNGGTLVGLSGGGAILAGGWFPTDEDDMIEYAYSNASSGFSPQTGWFNGGTLPVAGDSFTGVALPDGRALIAGGGYTTDGHFGSVLASASTWSGAAGWKSAGTMSTPRVSHTLTVLPDGRVLAAGGGNAPTADLYSPSENLWRAATPPGVDRRGPAAALTGDKVLLSGGSASGAFTRLTSAELYDPAKNTWTPAAPMRTGRAYFSATTLLDGRVLVTGGAGTRSAELWAPTTFVGTESAVVFEDTAPGSSATSRVHVTNTGTANLFVSGFALAGPGAFSIDAKGCAGAIAPGASCTVEVRYTPTAAGTDRTTLSFTANTAAGSHSVALSGRAVSPEAPLAISEIVGAVATADGDGDGVLDANDRCGALPGPAARLGCPAGLLGDPSIRYRAGKRGIKVLAYYVKATTGARVTVSCSGGACKPTTTTGKGAMRVRITRLNNRSLKNGTKITIVVSMPGRLTTTVTDTIARGRRVEGRPRCAPVAC